jgi:sirohydrochlorin ferrochelatase
MKSLLIIAHGSRRQASNDEVRALTKRISSKTDAKLDIVECAFLELAEPSIPDGIRQCVNQGAESIIVLPYFLSAGRHVIEDIPGKIDVTRKLFPQVDIQIAPYLGSLETIADLMVTQASQAILPEFNPAQEVKHAGNYF